MFYFFGENMNYYYKVTTALLLSFSLFFLSRTCSAEEYIKNSHVNGVCSSKSANNRNCFFIGDEVDYYYSPRKPELFALLILK